jgi:signal transduction histidine kinase
MSDFSKMSASGVDWPERAGKKRRRKIRYLKQSLRFPVAVMYILVIMLIVAEYFFLEGKFSTLSALDWVYLGGGFLGLLLLEWGESAWYPRRMILPVRLILLAVRIFCIAAIYQVENGVTSPTIAALIFYTAFFYFGLIPVLVLSLGFLALLVFLQPELLQAGLISQIAVILYMLMFAFIIKRDDRTRARNLELYRELAGFVSNSARLAKQDERNRISRELHDSLGHYLVGMNIQLQKAAAYREIDPAESDQAIQKAQQASQDAMRELRQTLSDLREMEDAFDFEAEVDKLAAEMEESGLSVSVSSSGKADDFPELVLTTLLRALQEGLTNVRKHAQATQVVLKIDFGRQDVNLLLSDDGIGFSKKQIDAAGHYGLYGLEERIELVGGKVKIQSRKNKGTKIQIRIPKAVVA